MKKSVLVIIMVIYVASIMFIGFFGMEIALIDEKLYVEEIIITNETCEQYSVYYSQEEGITYITLFYDDSYEGDWKSGLNPNAIILGYRVVPEDATNRNVMFSYDQNYEDGINPYGDVTQNGIVRFKRWGSITVTISALDGSSAKARVTVVARKLR